MTTSGFAIAIMAAGKGTRLKSKRPKVLHEIGGRALLLHVIAAAKTVVRADHIYCIIGHESDRVCAAVALTAVPADPTGYGRVLRLTPEGPEVVAIVEQKSLSPDQLNAPEINSGIYCFETKALFDKLDALDTNNAHGEFYLTDVAAMLVAEGKRVVAIKAGSVDEVLGANTIAEMMHLDAAIRLATARRLMANGVTIFRPETCVIDAQVTVGPDTVIEPYVQLLGATTIGSESRVRSYSV